MREIIGRLMACGVPGMTAACVCRHFISEGKADSLIKYVELVEAQRVD